MNEDVIAAFADQQESDACGKTDKARKRAGTIDLSYAFEALVATFLLATVTRTSSVFFFIWTTLLAVVDKFITAGIWVMQPVPDCIKYKKRLVLGTAIQLAFGFILIVTNKWSKTRSTRVNRLLVIDILLMEAVFVFRIVHGLHVTFFNERYWTTSEEVSAHH